MKIGFPNNPSNNILEEIKWIGENGFDFIDLFLEEGESIPEKININKTKKIIKRYNLHTVGHLGWYIPIGSPIRIVRDASIKEAIRYFKIFKKLKVKYVTIHTNWEVRGLFSEKQSINSQVYTLKKLVKAAKKYKLRLMLEPIGTKYDTPKNISKILKKVPGLFIHLDLGHCNLNGLKPHELIKKFHKRLKHIHLHDNNGKEDQHLPIGCGRIDWNKTIKTLKKYYNGTITLEIFSDDKDYVLMSKNKLIKLWNKY